MKITYELYSILSDKEVENRIGSLGRANESKGKNDVVLIGEWLEGLRRKEHRRKKRAYIPSMKLLISV
jgi:hypothetical protein